MSIGDYAVIGDGRSAALVHRDATIAWLCWPRFDAPSLFASILDEARGGAWRLIAEDARTSRRYVAGTNVLATTIAQPGGEAPVFDLLPLWPAEARHHAIRPEHELLRVIHGVSGEVALDSVVEARPEYGARAAAWQEDRLGMSCDEGHTRLVLRGDVPHGLAGGVPRARIVVRAGETIALSLSSSHEAPAVLPPMGRAAVERLQRTIDAWRAWSGRCRSTDPAVTRSALVLKMLAYAPSGAIVAAPTTSLPERIGGDLNWDYRYCWLRDASQTVRAMVGLGYHEEASAFVSWLLHSTRLTLPELQPLYDVYGRRPPRERVLPHLGGFRGSRPVRVGNGARDQLQLDVAGEVVCAAAQLFHAGIDLDRETAKVLVEIGRWVSAHWIDPDSGLWEPRVPPRAHTWSRVMCWAALRDLCDLAAHRVLPRRAPVAMFARVRDAIGEHVREHAWSERLERYTEPMGTGAIDAVLLLLPVVGFEDAHSPRMRATMRAIRAELGAGPGRLYRYRGSISAGEGAFGLCAFWEAHAHALAGDVDEARAVFDAASATANDVGLFAEESDPRTGEPLGNFPQAYTHIGHINASLAMERAAQQRGETHREEEARP